MKAPVYYDKGRLIDFSSKKDANLTLRSLVNSSDDGFDLTKGKSFFDSSEMERLTSKLKQPFYNKSTRNMITRSKLSSNNTNSKENNDDKVTPTDYKTKSFPSK